MPPGPAPTLPDDGPRRWIALAFALGMAARMAFTLSFPTIHGGDAAARLANAETLVLGYQLPLPQIFVVAGRALHQDPVAVRLLFCLAGAMMAAGGAALLARAAGPRAALFGAVLFAFDPLFIHYSIVPYQEPMAYGFLAWAFYFALSRRGLIGACFMAAACLSRYEAWLFLPGFLWITRSPLAGVIACLPMTTWLLWWQGLGPRGLYVLDIDVGAGRVSRVAYLASKFLEYETVSVVVLAVIGAVIARANRTVLALGAAITLSMILVVALGHEYPPGSGLMSERLIHLPVFLVLFLASIALGYASGRGPVALAVCLAAALLCAARNVRFETNLLRAAAADPDLSLARQVARALESSRSPGECVTVMAPRIDSALFGDYVAKVGAAFGDVKAARERAASLADASPDRDRIAANLKASTGTIRSAPGCPLLVVVDEDSAMASGAERQTADVPAGFELLTGIKAGSRQARILRRLQ